jgi:hypothetical protein
LAGLAYHLPFAISFLNFSTPLSQAVLDEALLASKFDDVDSEGITGRLFLMTRSSIFSNACDDVDLVVPMGDFLGQLKGVKLALKLKKEAESGKSKKEEEKKKQKAASTDIPECANCYSTGLLTGLTLSKCERCRLVSYCSVACQKQHWVIGFHEQFCVTPEERSLKAAAAAAAALALSEKEKEEVGNDNAVDDPNTVEEMFINRGVCPVCMGSLEDKKDAASTTATNTTTLPCTHVIHKQCLKGLRLFGEKLTMSVCPICRAELPPPEEETKPLSLDECACCGATKRANNKPLLPCSRCKSVAYCSKECQEKHWKEFGHKKKCPELKATHEVSVM